MTEVLKTTLIGIAVVVVIFVFIKYKGRLYLFLINVLTVYIFEYCPVQKCGKNVDSTATYYSYNSFPFEWRHRDGGRAEPKLGDSGIVPAGEGADPRPHIDWPPPPPPQPVEI